MSQKNIQFYVKEGNGNKKNAWFFRYKKSKSAKENLEFFKSIEGYLEKFFKCKKSDGSVSGYNMLYAEFKTMISILEKGGEYIVGSTNSNGQFFDDTIVSCKILDTIDNELFKMEQEYEKERTDNINNFKKIMNKMSKAERNQLKLMHKKKNRTHENSELNDLEKSDFDTDSISNSERIEEIIEN